MKAVLQSAAALALLALLSGAGTAPAPGSGMSPCIDRFSLIGLPEMEDEGLELCRPGYAVSYNADTRNPNWVVEHLTPDMLQGSAVRKNNFRADKDAPGSPTPDEYKGKPFDRGHQAPAADFKSSQAMTDQSFLMTNMAPQVGVGFNRHIWRYLETDVRNWVACGGMKDLYVITGPVYTGKERWMGKVRIPDQYFKIVFDPEHGRALGMLLDNAKLDPAKLPGYAVPIKDIETATGIIFFPALPLRERNVLKSSKGNLWGTDDSCTVNVEE